MYGSIGIQDAVIHRVGGYSPVNSWTVGMGHGVIISSSFESRAYSLGVVNVCDVPPGTACRENIFTTLMMPFSSAPETA